MGATKAIEATVESRSLADPEENPDVPLNDVEQAKLIAIEMSHPRIRWDGPSQLFDAESGSRNEWPSPPGSQHLPAFVAVGAPRPRAATYKRTMGVRHLMGMYDYYDQTLRGYLNRRKRRAGWVRYLRYVRT